MITGLALRAKQPCLALVLALTATHPTSSQAQAASGVALRVAAADSVRLNVEARVAAFVEFWRLTWTTSSARASLAPPVSRATDDRPFGTSAVSSSHRGERTPRLVRPLPSTYRALAMNTAYNRCISHEFPWWHLGALSPVVTRVSGPSSARGYCPGWSFYQLDAPEARFVVDSTLAAADIPRIRKSRDSVLAMLDSAAAAVPGDEWIVGQRVRLLVDQERFGDAVAAAEACDAAVWWCGLLRGFAYAAASDPSRAAHEFNTVREMHAFDVRCDWESVAPLLRPADQRAYLALSCDEQRALNERFWWLAYPLWSDVVNTRRVEHEMRRVQLLLRAALPSSELFTHTPEAGRDALHNVLIRYGWPATMVPAPSIQTANDNMLLDAGSPPSRPYAMLQYQRSRVHLAPAWRAVVDPFTATSDDWTLHEPDTLPSLRDGRKVKDREAERGFLRLNVSRERLALVLAHSVLWWPAEHFEPARPLVQLPDPQVALLRRERGVHLAVAASGADPLSYPDARYGYAPHPELPASARVNATVLLASSPSAIVAIGDTQVRVGSRAVVRGDVAVTGMDSVRTMLGVEVRSADLAGADARTRFGITIPPSLAALQKGDIALSLPVLLHGTLIDARTRSLDTVLSAMRSDDVMSGAEPLGVYWESYGMAATDSVSISVRISRVDQPSGVRRAAVNVGVANDARGTVTVQWREPTSERLTVHIDGVGGRAVGRLVLLNLSAQAPGEYLLEVDVRAADGRRASGVRRLWLR